MFNKIIKYIVNKSRVIKINRQINSYIFGEKKFLEGEKVKNLKI